jgi:TnpA family transposase
MPSKTAAIASQWTELMRLKDSIEAGAVVPSVILRKLSAAGAWRHPGRVAATRYTIV